jgi:SpoU rRNA methylase family enzyme
MGFDARYAAAAGTVKVEMIVVVTPLSTAAAESVICLAAMADDTVRLTIVAKTLQDAVDRHPVHPAVKPRGDLLMAKSRRGVA